MSHVQSMLQHLKHNVKCRLGVSKVHGIGVMAIRDIAAREEVFKTRLRRAHDRVDLTMDQITQANVPKPVVELMRSFFFRNDDAANTYPVSDLNALDVSFYLNHGGPQDANVEFAPCAAVGCDFGCVFEHMIASRAIQAGDELFLDYGKWSTDSEQVEHGSEAAASSDENEDGGKKRSRK